MNIFIFFPIYYKQRRILQNARLGDVSPSTCREMGKCTFADSWLEKDEFIQWLKPVSEHNHEAYCTYCKKKISVASMGINAVPHARC